MEDKLIGLLGLARRAGFVTFGSDAVQNDMAKGRAEVVLLSNDAAPRTVKNIRQVCGRYSVSAFVVPYDKSVLGHAIGRAETAVAAVTDKGFSARVSEICREITGGIY